MNNNQFTLAGVLRQCGMSVYTKQSDIKKVCVRLVAHTAGAYPGVCGTEQLGVFQLPPGWDASPSRG